MRRWRYMTRAPSEVRNGKMAVHPSVDDHPPDGIRAAGSDQVSLRHTGRLTYRCSLPGLAGLISSRCTGPGLPRCARGPDPTGWRL